MKSPLLSYGPVKRAVFRLQSRARCILRRYSGLDEVQDDIEALLRSLELDRPVIDVLIEMALEK